MTALFTRTGTEHLGAHHLVGGKPCFTEPKMCGRCGGLGGSDKWKHTGWTCFECGGTKVTGTRTVKLFTAEQLVKLNATAAKKAAKKTAAAEAKAAALAAEAAARAETFKAAHGALLAEAAPLAGRSEFVASVLAKAWARNELTENQEIALRNTIEKFKASAATKAASRHVGKIGERLTVTVTAKRVVSIETQFGTLRIATMRTAEGNTIVSKGRFVPPTAEWTEENGWVVGAEPFTIKASVKEHGSFNGELQTIVQRVAEVTP